MKFLTLSLRSMVKANKALISGKTSSDYDLPKKVKSKIASRHYSAAEINQAYAKSVNV